MSSGTSEEKIDDILFTFVQVDKESQAWLFEKNKQRSRGILSKENNDTDSTDSIFDFLSQISDSLYKDLMNSEAETAAKNICQSNVKNIHIIVQHTSRHS